MDTEWSVETLDGTGVALVTVELRNPSSVPRRVGVTNRLDGPVLPPRRAGVPEDGWHEDGFEGVVPADGRRVLGYASPAATVTPPVTVAVRGRADDEADAAAVDADVSIAAARDLGDPRPPADAVPVEWRSGGSGVTTNEADDHSLTDADADTESSDTQSDSEVRGDAERGVSAHHGEPGAESADLPDDLPRPVESWFATVERRVERGERLTDASVETAADELEACESVEALSECVAADADALQRLAIRASALAARADDVDVPVEDLRGFA